MQERERGFDRGEGFPARCCLRRPPQRTQPSSRRTLLSDASPHAGRSLFPIRFPGGLAQARCRFADEKPSDLLIDLVRPSGEGEGDRARTPGARRPCWHRFPPLVGGFSRSPVHCVSSPRCVPPFSERGTTKVDHRPTARSLGELAAGWERWDCCAN